MGKQFVMTACMIALVAGGIGCMGRRVSTARRSFPGPNVATSIRSAIIMHYRVGIGCDQIEVAFPNLITEWEQLFPSYADAVGVRDAGFSSDYRVIFMRPDGTASWVSTSREKWTNGRGNFPVNGDVDALYTKTTNYLHHIDENWPRGEIQDDGSIRVNFRAELLEDGTLRRLDPPPSPTPESESEP